MTLNTFVAGSPGQAREFAQGLRKLGGGTESAVSGATVSGWLFLGLGILVWVLCIPLTGIALYDLVVGNMTGVSSLESGIATTGAIVYGLVGAAGFAFIAQSEHRSMRVALPLYVVLLILAVAVAVGLHVLVGDAG
ncbi:hypothetical protein [Bounagaea algeriensis]